MRIPQEVLINDKPLNGILADHLKWLETMTRQGKKANFAGVDLHDVDLSMEDLREIDCVGVDLTGANLRKADLSGANIQDADFSNANLNKANLSGVKNISKAKGLDFADLTDAILDEETRQFLLPHKRM